MFRNLGFKETLAIVVGRIIGSGIFRTPGPIMIAVAGLEINRNYTFSEIPTAQITVGFFFIAWILGGISSMLSAFCYAELVAMFPSSGGPYVYLKKAYPPIVAFLRGWAMFFVSETASIVAVSFVFAEYGMFLMGHFSPTLGSLPILESLIALATIWTLTFSNCFGVWFSGFFQDIFALLKFVSIFAMIYFAFSSEGGSFSSMESHWWPPQIDIAIFLGLGEAMRYAFFAYSGWEGATYVAEEVKNPQRNLPRSLFWGIGTVMGLYLLVNLAYLYQLSPAEMIVSKKQVAAHFMQKSVGEAGAIILAVLVMISTFGNVGTQVMVKSRTWFAMAQDGLFPEAFKKLHPKYLTPNQSLLLQGGWASFLLLYASFSENSYETLIDLFSFTSAVFNVLTFVSVIVLRKKFPDQERSFRVPFFSITISIVLFIHAAFLVITFMTRPISSLLGVLLTLSGLFYYFRLRKA